MPEKNDTPAAEECCRLKCDYDRCQKTHGITLPDLGQALPPADPANRIEAEPACRPEKLAWEKCKQEKLFCQEFARRARDDQQTNLRYQCGLAGAIWAEDEKGYRDRCLRNRRSRNEMATEAKEREDRLAECKSQHELCDRYARGSVLQQKLNLEKRCGNQGAGWSSEYQPFYGQCRQGKFSKQKVKELIAVRNRSLIECQSKQQDQQRQLEANCRAYSAGAAKQQLENLKTRCGQKGDWWISDQQRLYRLCLDRRMSPQALRKQWQARKRALEHCTKRLQSFAGLWYRTGKVVTPGYTINVDDALRISVQGGRASIYNQRSGYQCRGTVSGPTLRWRCDNSIAVEEGTYRLEPDGLSFKGESQGNYKVGGSLQGTYQGDRQ